MRSLLFILISCICTTTAEASNLLDKINIGSNSKTNNLEVRFNSTDKRVLTADVVILNAIGEKVSVFKCNIKQGMNAVSLQNALNLKEGVYTVSMTVKKRTSSTKFVLFK